MDLYYSIFLKISQRNGQLSTICCDRAKFLNTIDSLIKILQKAALMRTAFYLAFMLQATSESIRVWGILNKRSFCIFLMQENTKKGEKYILFHCLPDPPAQVTVDSE